MYANWAAPESHLIELTNEDGEHLEYLDAVAATRLIRYLTDLLAEKPEAVA